jgi:hypothetical protein
VALQERDDSIAAKQCAEALVASLEKETATYRKLLQKVGDLAKSASNASTS